MSMLRRLSPALIVGAILVAAFGVLSHALPGSCATTVNLHVTSSTEKDDLIAAFAEDYNAAGRAVDGKCGNVTVAGVSSGTAKNGLATGWRGPGRPDVWLPTSSMWLRLLQHEGKGGLVADAGLGSITASTLVIAMPKRVADALNAAGTRFRTWEDVLALANTGWADHGKDHWGDFVLARDNPESSTSGLAASVATYHAATGGDFSAARLDDSDVVSFVHGIESAVSRYGENDAVVFMEELYEAEQQNPQGRPEFDAIVVQEQLAYLYNEGAPGAVPSNMREDRKPRDPLVVIHPPDDTLKLDHPFLVMASASSDQRAVARDFYQFLIEEPQQKRFLDLGFRDRDNAAQPSAQLTRTLGIPAAQRLRFVGTPDGASLATMLNSWDSVRRKTRVLLVLDVSDSMNEVVDDPETSQDPRKLDLLKPAAKRAVDLLDAHDEIGLWTFSSGPYREVVPISPVGEVHDRVQDGIDGLTAKGSTALYHTIDAANQTMAATFDHRMINAIVVLSDGKNTAPYAGGPAALLSTLDPENRESTIPIFTVPYGRDDVDVKTLSDISRLTKAAQYDASNPLTVEDALVRVFRNFG